MFKTVVSIRFLTKLFMSVDNLVLNKNCPLRNIFLKIKIDLQTCAQSKWVCRISLLRINVTFYLNIVFSGKLVFPALKNLFLHMEIQV